MISRRSSGSMRADSAVEPTRSENITVTWRRSARSSTTVSAFGAAVTEAFTLSSTRRAAIASRILRRCPTIPTPKSFRSSAVRFGRTVQSISFSRNAASYRSRPRLRSQAPISICGPRCRPAGHDWPTQSRCLQMQLKSRFGVNEIFLQGPVGRGSQAEVDRLSDQSVLTSKVDTTQRHRGVAAGSLHLPYRRLRRIHETDGHRALAEKADHRLFL